MSDREKLEDEIEDVHKGKVDEYRAIDMELVWKCLQCGYLTSRERPAPSSCPRCGAPETDFEAIVED